MRASGACATIIASETPWEEWRSELGLRRGRGPDVVALLRLGHASDCLRGRPAEARRAFRDGLQAPSNASISALRDTGGAARGRDPAPDGAA